MGWEASGEPGATVRAAVDLVLVFTLPLVSFMITGAPPCLSDFRYSSL